MTGIHAVFIQLLVSWFYYNRRCSITQRILTSIQKRLYNKHERMQKTNGFLHKKNSPKAIAIHPTT